MPAIATISMPSPTIRLCSPWWASHKLTQRRPWAGPDRPPHGTASQDSQQWDQIRRTGPRFSARSGSKARKKTSQTDLVGGLNHLEKYQSGGMIIPNSKYMEKWKCSKPPTSDLGEHPDLGKIWKSVVHRLGIFMDMGPLLLTHTWTFSLKKIRYGYLALSVADQDASRKMSTQD